MIFFIYIGLDITILKSDNRMLSLNLLVYNMLLWRHWTLQTEIIHVTCIWLDGISVCINHQIKDFFICFTIHEFFFKSLYEMCKLMYVIKSPINISNHKYWTLKGTLLNNDRIIWLKLDLCDIEFVGADQRLDFN